MAGLQATSRNVYKAEFESWDVKSKYVLQRLLGHGAYGKVASAIDKSADDKQVAIKYMEGIFHVNQDARRAFREIHILRSLRSFGPPLVEGKANANPDSRSVEDKVSNGSNSSSSGGGSGGGGGSATLSNGHPNVITLLDVFTPAYTPPLAAASRGVGGLASPSPTANAQSVRDIHDLYAVFEFMDTDLSKIIKSFGQTLSIDHIKFVAFQMMAGLKFIHSARVIHRDLKPANILINCSDCETKIADFGLSRVVDETLVIHPNSKSSPSVFSVQATPLKRTLTTHVVTRWYRAPEIILMQRYTSAVDVWSMGCILAEMFAMQTENENKSHRGKPLFPGTPCGELSLDDDEFESFEQAFKEESSQLMVIFKIIGTPRRDDFSNYDREAQHNLELMRPIDPKNLAILYPNTPPEGLDLLKKMLLFDPSKRIDCDGALNHPFFDSCRQDSARSILDAKEFMKIDLENAMESSDRLFSSIKSELDHYP